ncbi:lytic transglycosylase domain-containing protein [Sphingomonas daechungensis]|uniref:lytic transglycosylase domain-containing protein n=1 Tax=Sphingomonas daechungensis TaxID=1176646 RepID=UPI0037842929
MSSMRGVALTVLLVTSTAGSTQSPYSVPAQSTAMAAPAYGSSVGYSLNDWRRLRQNSGYTFADYARFLNANPGWPEESKLRGWAEKAMRPGENAGVVLAFFSNQQPQTGNGYARLADALSATGRTAETLAAARAAWASPDLSAYDEQSILSRYGRYFTVQDHDQRTDALLFAKDPTDAQRFLAMTSPARQAAFTARVAMQSRWPDAEARYQAVIGQVTVDAGLMMDRARYLRDANWESSARQLFARDHNFRYRPVDPERFMDMQLLLANGAAQDGSWALAYNITRQTDDVLPPGVNVSDQPLGIRDKYTSLMWLGGTAAWSGLNRPNDAVVMFDRYSRGGKSLQVLSKGLYWAGKASLSARRGNDATAYFQRAAVYPELFYGQLALEQLGRAIPAPGPLPTFAVSPAQRAEFGNRRLVQAVQITGSQGRRDEQTLFVRALAESLNNDAERVLATQFGQRVDRQDIGVWVARMARVKGNAFYVETAYPRLPVAVQGGRMWSLAHGITRQESSFDRAAVSHAGARGMMQLMPGTAREQAGKMGLGYDGYRLTSDPSYNVTLGTAYFQRMLNIWDGNAPLAVASYNAGSGAVGRWVRQYGDPRGRKDVLQWIEQIPYSETKAYVQRVIENSVVYDRMNPSNPTQAVHVSRFLGKSAPG